MSGRTAERLRAALALAALGAAASLLALSCARRPREAATPPAGGGSVRVGLSAGRDGFAVRIAGAWTACDAVSGRTLARGRALAGPVACGDAWASVGAERFLARRVRLAPASDGDLVVNAHAYAGELVLSRGASGGPVAVNVLPLERYLAGVLGCEVDLRWPREALKAQIVAARTYAVLCRRERRDGPWDVVDSTQDQCYQGLAHETPESRRISAETAGVVLTYHHAPFWAFYSAVCGGHTADGPKVLRGKAPAIAPLRGRPCPYCEGGLPPERQGRYRWRLALRRADLEKALGIPGRLTALSPVDPDEGGHAGLVHTAWANGGSRDMDMREFRPATKVTSNAWTAEVLGDEVVFEGRGFGHGVGLCQWGAKRMAEEGFDHAEILRFYYPGSRMERYD